MSSYIDFLKVISKLQTNTYFAVTYDWCIQNGLKLLPKTARSWGKNFTKDCTKYNCTKLSTGTDNHNFYQKN